MAQVTGDNVEVEAVAGVLFTMSRLPNEEERKYLIDAAEWAGAKATHERGRKRGKPFGKDAPNPPHSWYNPLLRLTRAEERIARAYFGDTLFERHEREAQERGAGFAVLCQTAAVTPPVFVFGSNVQGVHGKGAALFAKQHWGAIQGQGAGIQGWSYAIPTRTIEDGKFKTLPLRVIANHVRFFLEYARSSPTVGFRVTALGTGLAGYSHEEMAPLFAGAPPNCILPPEWEAILERRYAEL